MAAMATPARRWAEVVSSVIPGEFLGELEPMLEARIARAAVAWPNVRVDEDQFVHAIAQRLVADAPVRALEAMHTDDLYLACGCAAADPGALASFEEHYGSVIARAIATTATAVSEHADLGQIVRQRLLVAAPDGGVPRIATYSGRGSLRAWMRVVVTREAARRVPRKRREVLTGDDDLAGLIVASDDPELGYLKRLYRHEFRHAFHAAVKALDNRERLLLRQYAIKGLSIDELATLHRVHRATAARWIQTVREAVRTHTQHLLVRRLRVSPSELASVLRLIQSQLDITMPRALRHG